MKEGERSEVDWEWLMSLNAKKRVVGTHTNKHNSEK